MKARARTSIAIAGLSLLLAASSQAADWDLWPYPDAPPLAPGLVYPVRPPIEDEEVWLTFLPGVTPGLTTASETDSSIFFVDVGQTREKDGQLYKAIQFYRDVVVEDTVAVGQWVHGGPDNCVYPPGTVDCLAFEQTWRLISLEIDGTAIPIDMDTWLHLGELDLTEYGLGVWPVAWYGVAVRYNTLGQHTYQAVFRQVEEYFYIEPYEGQGLVDPSPEYEGRRVLVGEQVGDPVDGDIVYTCNVTVVAELPDGGTAVQPASWGGVKASLQE